MLTSTERTTELRAEVPTAAVRRYVDAFNAGDEDQLAACFTAEGFILDGMAPHVFAGPSATRDWYRHAIAASEPRGITNFHMMLGAPTHDASVGDVAYFAAPATLSFEVHGQHVAQAGATFTVALRKVNGEWLIQAWAWTRGGGSGVDDVPKGSD